jgi:hypothetical protein
VNAVALLNVAAEVIRRGLVIQRMPLTRLARADAAAIRPELTRSPGTSTLSEAAVPLGTGGQPRRVAADTALGNRVLALQRRAPRASLAGRRCQVGGALGACRARILYFLDTDPQRTILAVGAVRYGHQWRGPGFPGARNGSDWRGK